MLKILITLLFSINAYAHFDFSAGGALRSYPALGGEFNAESGYNQLLWGDGPGPDKNKVFYGLIRPTLGVSTSAVINNYDARLEFYPISFIGIVKGKVYIKSDFDKFSFYDCEKVRCMGTLERDYTTVKMALGFGPIMMVGSVTMSVNTYSDELNENKPVAEFRFATLAHPDADKMYRSQYVLAYKHSNRGIIGIVAEYTSFSESDQTNNMDLIIYTTKPANTTYVFGIGQFESTNQAHGLITVFQMKTDFIPSDKIF